MRGFCTDENDPDLYLVDWLRDGAPIGVARPTPESGIFPAPHRKPRLLTLSRPFTLGREGMPIMQVSARISRWWKLSLTGSFAKGTS